MSFSDLGRAGLTVDRRSDRPNVPGYKNVCRGHEGSPNRVIGDPYHRLTGVSPECRGRPRLVSTHDPVSVNETEEVMVTYNDTAIATDWRS